MAKRKIKRDDHRSVAKVGCAIMTISGSHYVWTCEVSGKVIIRQDSIRLTNPKYEKKSALRQEELMAALERHSRGNHR